MGNNERINIRIDENLKKIWEESKDKSYYKDLTSFIINCVNDYIYSNKLTENLEHKKLLEDRKRIEQKKIITERRQINRSIGFAISRLIQVINKYLKQKDFIDILFLENEIDLIIDESKLTDDPARFLLGLLPHLINNELLTCKKKIVDELKRLGVSEEEIKKVHFPRNSINSTIRKIN